MSDKLRSYALTVAAVLNIILAAFATVVPQWLQPYFAAAATATAGIVALFHKVVPTGSEKPAEGA
jgi:hypothetical protein